MQRLVRQLVRTLGLAHDPAAPSQSAERPLRVLILASIVLPVALFTIASWISHRAHFADARERLQANLSRVSEHAIKVFDTFDLSSRYLDELLHDVSNEQIRQNEAEYSTRLSVVISTLPQLRDLWIVDENGHPLVSGTINPMPKLELADRDYFKVHKNNEVNGAFISGVLNARVGTTNFFVISRKREIGGRFAGVTIISVAPEYFSNYYAELSTNEGNTISLIRTDGVLLARYPEPAVPQAAPAGGRLLQAIRDNPERGMLVNRSVLDGVERTLVYRKLPRNDVYLFTSFANDAVIANWLRDMSEHLYFGIPATAMMIGLGAMALRRTRRLQQEIGRREATEQALRQSQKMEAVGRLSGGIAHDFNNMLTVILGNIDMASRRLGDDNPRVHRQLDSARQASERAAMLVQRLLAFSRQHPQEVKSVDINRLVHGMSELLRRTIGETIVTETVLAGGLWRVAVDPNQLENAILNLAVNARDAMPDGGRLTIETSNSYLDEAYTLAHGGELAHGQYVMIAVSDTGTGMSKEVIDRAFEPFFTTKPTGMGTGLGLSMVYGFAKQSDGHIKIYSEAGEGTAIKLYFPRVTEQSALTEWSDDERSRRPVAVAGGAETILLVEDDEEVKRFSSEVLRDQGYNVHAAPDGASALRLLDGAPVVDMLFTDVILPGGMNGRQLADEVMKRRPGIKVLFATGYTRNAIIHHGRLDADVELLTKPFTAEALARKVRQILDGAAAGVATNA